MRKSILIFVLPCLLVSLVCSMDSSDSMYPYFSDAELSDLRLKDIRAYNRVLHYELQLKKLHNHTKKEQLIRLNLYINGLLSQHDTITNTTLEYWATPKEFLRLGFGDCEDYALLKYYSLIKLGFDKKKLYLVAVKEKFTNSNHMVLAYFEHEKRAPLILDNLSFRVLPLDKRVDLQANFFINSDGIYRQQIDFSLQKIEKIHKKFNEISNRVDNGL